MKRARLEIDYRPLSSLIGNPDNPRLHNRKQRRLIARSIRRYGFVSPILIDEQGNIIAGHGRRDAAEDLGLEAVPVIVLAGLSEPEKRALMVADNRIAEGSSWNGEKLTKLLRDLVDIDFDIQDTGFDTADVDIMLNNHDGGAVVDEADFVSEIDRSQPPVSRRGDLFHIGDHRLSCDDALDQASYERLLGGLLAAAIISDPPFNVPTAGHITSSKRSRHPSFAMAAGEMSEAEFTAFLRSVMEHLCRFSQNGSLHYLFMDWRHLYELLTAARALYELKNLCAWVKDNGGQGSHYRSQHELVAVLKNGDAPHVNNIELGRYGRNRTNVWRYPGVNTMRKGRLADLDAHPPVKPVALVADAILDCTPIGGLVLDPFVGSGTTVLACQRTGRRAATMEIDPYYVDTAIRRVQERTGLKAVHQGTGLTFDELASRQEAGNER